MVIFIIKKITGGKDAMLLGDFALEPLTLIDSIDFKQVLICQSIATNHIQFWRSDSNPDSKELFTSF